MIRRPPRSTQSRSSAASDVYKRQRRCGWGGRRARRSHRGRAGDPVPLVRGAGGVLRAGRRGRAAAPSTGRAPVSTAPPVGPKVSAGYVTFRIGCERYATAVEMIREVVRLERLAVLPAMAGALAGVLDLRGEPLPVVDVRDPRRALDRPAYAVV